MRNLTGAPTQNVPKDGPERPLNASQFTTASLDVLLDSGDDGVGFCPVPLLRFLPGKGLKHPAGTTQFQWGVHNLPCLRLDNRRQ